MVIRIRNMVCPRCVKVVRSVLDSLSIAYDDVRLGEAELKETISSDLMDKLKASLAEEGFEVLSDKQASEVENIRLLVIAWARMEGERPALSQYLQEHIFKEYSSISKLFSQMQSVTIERYALLQRIEYAKELISYGDKTLSEIAWILGFSSPAHFSSQFKKETGMSPSQFRGMSGRSFIDRL